MFDLKFHAKIKHMIDSSERGVIIDEVVYYNKNQKEKMKNDTIDKSFEINQDLLDWICERYITRKDKIKYFTANRYIISPYSK